MNRLERFSYESNRTKRKRIQPRSKKVYEKQLIGSGFNASLDFTTTDKSKPYSIDMATFDYIEHSHS